VLGLPGNPVSALICARVFLVPLIERLVGINRAAVPPRLVPTTVPLEANGPRTHYMRAVISPNTRGDWDGDEVVTPLSCQDSSRLSVLSQANCLLIRPTDGPALPVGSPVPIMLLDF
jgi:molybdopterin molybdotransferase